ncbi:MAG: type II toxin-antitoxin system Phd/YefM family antitoxin [Alphaproteobacteria bacterium]|nr:type II toxin-antitoxin system Phd/YefM family antitoxin [Alphaproteobacteria bacterium]MCW5742374.1 type II toxin-antitoxin system Phd/YefM family antitoxin [Alphaproteobacteria bacterium]
MVRKPAKPRRTRKPHGLAEPKARPFKAAPATWQLQHAKNRFSELVAAALREGPQEVTRHGKPAVVVMSKEEYDRLTGAKAKPQRTFIDFILNGPKIDGFDQIMEDVMRENRQMPDSSFDPDRDLDPD